MRVLPGRSSLIGWLAILVIASGALALLRVHVILDVKRGERLIHDFRVVVTQARAKKAASDFYERNRENQRPYGVSVAASHLWFLPYVQDGECIEPYRRAPDASIASLGTGAAEKWIARLVGARCWYVLAGVGKSVNDNDALRVFTVLEPPESPWDPYQWAMMLTVLRAETSGPHRAPVRRDCDISDKLRNDFHIWIARGTDPIIVFGEEATVEERVRLTTVNTACFSRPGASCHGFKEIMPFAAADMETEYREYREEVKKLFAEKPECRGWVPLVP